MTKKENPNIFFGSPSEFADFIKSLPFTKCYEVEVDDDNRTISFSDPFEYNLDYDEFAHVRREMYNAIAEKTNLPRYLIEAAESCNHEKSEWLSFALRFHLEKIRQTEKKGTGPAYSNSITRSEIAFVACDYLEQAIGAENPQLVSLIKGLLGTDKTEISLASEQKPLEKKRTAFELKLLYPNASQNSIARAVGVSNSTASRWFKADDAEEELERAKHSHAVLSHLFKNHPNLSMEEFAAKFELDEKKVKFAKSLIDFTPADEEE